MWRTLPDPSSDISTISDSPRNGEGESRDIPFSRTEALRITKTHNKLPILADQNARSAFEVQAKSARILYLSTHGNFIHESPILSSIHLLNGSLTVLNLSKLVINPNSLSSAPACLAFLRFSIGAVLSASHIPFSARGPTHSWVPCGA